MPKSDTFRLAAMSGFVDRGYDTSGAGLAALAICPFDDSPVPSRGFEKQVRKRSRQAARALRNTTPADGVIEATSALYFYKTLAIALGEPHYADRFDRALGLSPDRPVRALSDATLHRARQRSREVANSELVNLFESGLTNGFGDYDAAVQGAIDTRARVQAGVVGGQENDALRRDLGSYIIAGYQVGQLMMASSTFDRDYVDQEQCDQAIGSLLDGIDDVRWSQMIDSTSTTSAFLNRFAEVMLSEPTPVTELGDDVSYQMVGVCLQTGVFIALAEYERLEWPHDSDIESDEVAWT